MLTDLSRLSSARSRSLSPENPTGAKGQGALAEPDATSCSRELGKGRRGELSFDCDVLAEQPDPLNLERCAVGQPGQCLPVLCGHYWMRLTYELK